MRIKRLLGIFNRFSQDSDFSREFRQATANRRDRRLWLERGVQGNLDEREREARLKKARHDRRLKNKEDTYEKFGKKKRQKHF
ncbi:hypothetical protein LCGC14_1368170 [marine sediment metagenome]|uniref:Uncharacterized protein n=1 Tax=marine sediment metagenome TaxID=412755 RepID=A0A0F9K643_9ZZZZ